MARNEAVAKVQRDKFDEIARKAEAFDAFPRPVPAASPDREPKAESQQRNT